MNIWAVLAFVAVCNTFMLAAAALGAYAVYRTKREDGYILGPRETIADKGQAIHLDDLTPAEETDDGSSVFEDILQRNGKFHSVFSGRRPQ